MSEDKEKKPFDQDLMNEVVINTQQVMGVIDLYEPARANEKAFTHLEEALFWIQVMIANGVRKPIEFGKEAVAN
jgi:hypothetical protein